MYDFSKLRAYLDTLPGVGVPCFAMSVWQHHAPLFEYALGNPHEGDKAPVRPDVDLYFLYSCTKPLTAAVGMRLWEEGLLDLDAPVSRYLPEFENVFILKNGQKARPNTVMTVRHLFTMSAGFNYDRQTEPIRSALARYGAETTTRQIVDAIIESPLCFNPGERFQYSLCHDVLGAVIEAASGMPFDECINKIAFEPIGMHDSSFLLTPERLERMADMYAFNGETRTYSRLPLRCEHSLSDRYVSGGAGLISTQTDYARFADALACGMAQNGAHFLKRATIDTMRTEQLTKLVKDPTFGCAAGPGYGYGLGVRTLIDKSQGQRSPLGEFGWDGAAGAYIMADADNGISVTFTMHIHGWPSLLNYPHAPIRDAVYEAMGL